MSNDRIAREKRIVERMIRLYCRKHHTGCDRGELCEDCASLLQYADRRLEKCRYGVQKTACKYCPTHCYSSSMRTQIRVVMRWAGPRMLFYAPIAALRHLFDGMTWFQKIR